MSEDVNDKSTKKAAESNSDSTSGSSTNKTSSSKSAAAKSSSESKSTNTRSAAASSKSSSSSSSSGGGGSSKPSSGSAANSAEQKATAGGTGSGSSDSKGSASGSSGGSAGGSGQPQHVASGLSYVLGPITGAVFLFLDRSDSVVRHHACQALLLSAVIVVAWLAVAILSVNFIGIPLVFWAGFAFLLYMAYLAHQQKSWEIPFLNDYAQRLADKLAPGENQGK